MPIYLAQSQSAKVGVDDRFAIPTQLLTTNLRTSLHAQALHVGESRG